jgi:hypothetical protein
MRFFKVSLSTIFLLFTVLCLWLAWHAENVKRDLEFANVLTLFEKREKAQRQLKVFSSLNNAGVDVRDTLKNLNRQIDDANAAIDTLTRKLAQ